MESTTPPCIMHVDMSTVDTVLVTESAFAEIVVVPVVAANGKVVAAPTSLPTGKHMAVRVIDESSKRVLQDHNGNAMYGPIRPTTAKGVKQNSNVAKHVARKDTKVKKRADVQSKQTVVADWASKLSSSLSKEGLMEASSGNVAAVGALAQSNMVQWIENSTFEGDSKPNP
ncbi:hypothetical protein V6N13_019949 [Hibiscus sabdariffa]|uniref:Uncharacterized protein n=1 Tax=Hibiscus sabdariffa TaxID=183260 RepID=A0ABR2ETU5_9ROSI